MPTSAAWTCIGSKDGDPHTLAHVSIRSRNCPRSITIATPPRSNTGSSASIGDVTSTSVRRIEVIVVRQCWQVALLMDDAQHDQRIVRS